MKIIRPYQFAEGGTPFSRPSSASMWDKTGTLVSVGNDTPRFSYDPLNTANPPILLLEQAATNQLLYSEQLDNTSAGAWTTFQATVTPNAATAPDGTLTADKFCNNGASEQSLKAAGSYTAGQQYTASVYAKASDASVFVATISTVLSLPTSNGGAQAIFNLVNGTVSSVSIGISAAISFVGNGWYRCSLTFTPGVTLTSNFGGYWLNLAMGASAPGVGVYLWGAQLENGPVATSYIKTVGAAATRAADGVGNNLITLLAENDAPNWSSTNPYVIGDRVVVNHRIYQSNTGASSSVSVSTAASGSPIVVNWNAHGAALNEPVVFVSGAVPTGLVAGVVYYVQSTTANTFQVSTTVNGVAIVSASAFGTIGGVVARHSANLNQTPSSTSTVWLDAGPTNKYGAFDQSVESQSVNSYELNFAFQTPSTMFADSLVIQNANAQAIRVAIIDPVDGIVYDQTVTMVQDLDSADPYEYCFEPIVRMTDVMFDGIPPYASATLSVSLIDPYGSPACGLCIVGQSKEFGPTQSGMSIGIQDYSLKTKDEFGYTNLQERPYAKTMTLTAFVDRAAMSNLINLLNSLRATPVVYIGDESVIASFQYGFFKDYSMGADYVEHSTLHIEIESLT
jgi:hypothetical protein